MLCLPTAPFAETAVLTYIRKICGGMKHVTLKADKWGNLIARYRFNPPAGTPLVFAAHTDHPGFVALKMLSGNMLRASFRGWVEPEYFAGTRVRFHNGSGWIRGVVTQITKTAQVYRMIGRTARPEEVEVQVEASVPAGAAGMWDLPDPVLREGVVYARGCDDIAGCAAMLTLLDRLNRRRTRADVYCLFTRAEEVGFIGAIAAAKSGSIPRRLPIVAIETSKALPNAPIGEGPILRVGDKSSVFTPELTAFVDHVAKGLLETRKNFAYQRKLMDGGTCESTAFCAYGYAATGVCVALGNYHNMDTVSRKIASEYISLDDWEHMVELFDGLVRARPGFKPGVNGALRKNLDERFGQWRKLL
jgi:putative aminopeptidase FrvX